MSELVRIVRSFWFLRWVATIFAGSRRVCWEGLEVFHLNLERKILGKFTYANYPFPRFKKDVADKTSPSRHRLC